MRKPRAEEIARVALSVGDALRRAGIPAVLTGGACASLYSRGAYTSLDVDFVLSGTVTQRELDEAMAVAGFSRRLDRYVHPKSAVFVEFPRGPLAIGGDVQIRPVRRRRGRQTTLALSATDSCMDRLAAYYHWNDRQSLRAAVEIALRNRVSMGRIAAWSRDEDAGEPWVQFRAMLADARKRRRLTGRR